MQRKQVVSLALLFGLVSGSILATPVVSAKKKKPTILPSSLRSHVWYRTTTGTEGGVHDRTTFKKNNMHIHFKGEGTYWWKLSKVKRHNKKIYYATLTYPDKSHDRVEIKIINKKQFWLVSKHQVGTLYSKKAYTGNAKLGAQVFKR